MPAGCSVTLVMAPASDAGGGGGPGSPPSTPHHAIAYFNTAPAAKSAPCGGDAAAAAAAGPTTLYGAALKNDIGGSIGVEVKVTQTEVTVAIVSCFHFSSAGSFICRPRFVGSSRRAWLVGC